MKFNKGIFSIIFRVTAGSAMALMSLSLAWHAWQNNFWSVQYVHNAFSPTANQSLLTDPPVWHARAALWKASAAFQSGNPALAETLIASQAAHGDQFAMRLMADVLLARGDFAEAVAIWQQVGDVASLQKAGSQAQQAGLLEEANIAYEAAWKLDSESGTLPLADFLLDSRKDYIRAEYVLRLSLSSFPNSKYWPKWSDRLGDALRAQNRWDEAIALYESVIVKNPEEWAAHIGLGWARYERGDGFQAAMREFQEAINAPESQGSGQFAIAQVLMREKQFGESETWFRKALVLNPNARWWYIAQGNAAWQAGNLALALELYQETVSRFPDFAYAYYQIAYASQMNEQPTQAMAAIEQALVLMTPPNAYYYALAGSIFEWTGDESRALNFYRQALRIDPRVLLALEGVERLDK